MLRPHRWGRLCGEQEDLRLALAEYLGIAVRTCFPLDWDHIWSEYAPTTMAKPHQNSDEQRITINGWLVGDENARNFAVRLDEGIGFWTYIFAIHPNPDLCKDVTKEYLTTIPIGRIDIKHALELPRYQNLVDVARTDKTGALTQAQTVQGYAIFRAKMDAADITKTIQEAASDYQKRIEWWKLK